MIKTIMTYDTYMFYILLWVHRLAWEHTRAGKCGVARPQMRRCSPTVLTASKLHGMRAPWPCRHVTVCGAERAFSWAPNVGQGPLTWHVAPTNSSVQRVVKWRSGHEIQMQPKPDTQPPTSGALQSHRTPQWQKTNAPLHNCGGSVPFENFRVSRCSSKSCASLVLWPAPMPLNPAPTPHLHALY